MPIPQTYYLNGNDLQSSTAVFLDAALTICAPDGYYSDGTITRKQISCVLSTGSTCQSCCKDTCSLWNFKSISGAFTVSYTECSTGDIVEVTYPDPTDEDICVVYGTTPTLVSGDADLTLKKECGCCLTTCSSWLLQSDISSAASFFYKDCDGNPVTISIIENDSTTVCSIDGYQPELIAGIGTVSLFSCEC